MPCRRWRCCGSKNHFPFNNSAEVDVTSGASRHPPFLLFVFIHLLMPSTSSPETGLTTAYCPVRNIQLIWSLLLPIIQCRASKQTNLNHAPTHPLPLIPCIISPRVSISTTQLPIVGTLLRGNSSNHQLLLFTQAERLPKTKTSSAMLPSSPSSSPPPPSLRLPGPSAFTGQSIYKVRSFHCIQTEFYSCR